MANSKEILLQEYNKTIYFPKENEEYPLYKTLKIRKVNMQNIQFDYIIMRKNFPLKTDKNR